jgi:rubrerythrin
MDLVRSLKKLGLKSILSSALILEQEIYNLYNALKAELSGTEVPPSLVYILDEELGHQQLIRDLSEGRIGEEETKKILEGGDLHIHDPEAIEALPAERYGPILQRLQVILEKEVEIYRLFAGLHHKAKIPFVRRAFRFLEDQERTHVRVLERLLGREKSRLNRTG